MMEHPPRRRPQTRFTGKREEGDPYLTVLITQLLICALLIMMGYALQDANPPFYPSFCTGYGQLISARQVQLPENARQLREQAADMAAGWITGLLETQQPQQQDTPQGATAKEEASQLTGAGGWMGSPADSSARLLPDSCSAAPMITNAGVHPPISGKVTSPYGYRSHPITGETDFHRGLDIAAAQGSDIRAALPGRVSQVGESAIYGNYITLDHGNGLTTTYCHCEQIIAQQGANLRQGELVATVGSTGISTGPHVHFEIAKNGKYYNPAWVIDGMGTNGI